MKKTLIIAGLLAITFSLAAEKMTLCQAFEKLANNCADFKPLIGTPTDPKAYELPSLVEIDQAKKSIFHKLISPTSFEATYGTFNSEAEAFQFIKTLQQQFKACYPIARFSEIADTILRRRDFKFVLQGDNQFRVFEACFRMSRYGKTWDVKLHFPQTEASTLLSNGKSAYQDYQHIEMNADDSAFGFGLKLLLGEAMQGFSGIKGDLILDPSNMFDRFEARFMPTGCEKCYIEDRGLGIVFYEIPICKEVDKQTITEKSQKFFSQLMSALGSEYAYSASPNGMTVTLVRRADPAHRLGTLFITQKKELYSMVLSLDAMR